MSEPNPRSKPPEGAEGLDWVRPARQKRSQRVLESVLDAAQRLTNERPFDEISVVEICKAAGCSVPGFYRRFPDKEALLHALHTRHIAAAIATAQVALDPERWERAPIREVTAALIDLLARTDYQASGLRLTAARRAIDDDRFAERIRAARSAVFEGMRQLLFARRDEFRHPDPDLAARFLIRMTYGVLTRHFEGASVDEQVHPLSERELVDELTRAALTYLGVHARRGQEKRMTSENHPRRTSGSIEHYDVVVIGAGVSGMYALHHLREMGLSVRVYEGASDVGGTWWYNRYPGARVDGPGSPFYCYTFSEELMKEWEWAETQSEQSAVLDYLEHVADRFDLRRDIQFETWVRDARYDEAAQRWTVETSTGLRASAQFLICAVGALSTANMPDIPGIHDFAGECYHTGRWPHEPVSFEGKRVAVIGTGSSGIQSIPEIAREAAHLTVLQRTPQYAFPAGNRPITPGEMAEARASWESFLAKMRAHTAGFPFDAHARSALDATPEEREALYEELWQRGGFKFFLDVYFDTVIHEEANESLADFVRAKIREIVRDPETAEKLLPDHFVMTKRPILEDGYFETYNRDNVTLVDLRDDPIERFTPTSVVTRTGEHPIDMLVLATGYDAISGSMLRLNPKGRGGVSLKERWNDRFHNYLGMTIGGFPNLFMIHGPGSPGVFYNMPLGAERQIDWIGDFVRRLREQKLGAVEATTDSEDAWATEVSALANATLFPRTDSWWTGANVEGKPRYFSAYLGGSIYYQRIGDVAAKGYEGFAFEQAHCVDDTQAS